MSTMDFIWFWLVVNIVLMIYTIVKTRKLNIHTDSKILIYVLAVLAPVFGFILFLIRSRQQSKTSIN
jgi:uncharacterized membrane protein YqjE